MIVQTLIVDDETLARVRIKRLLSEESEIELIAECDNGTQAITLISERRPDLVFLDVQMPEVNGFDIVRAIPLDSLPAIIFVTAHDQHAMAAFEVQALDFLLKPFTAARFHEAVRRSKEHIRTCQTAAINQRLLESLNVAEPAAQLRRIAIKNNDRTLFIRIEEIDYFESAANYIVIHAGSENHILRETLTNLESKLPSVFQRISRSVIVNLDRVKELQPALRGEYFAVLKNNQKLNMTRGLREVQERLQYS
jgi:two-component system LytT family response regulator